MNNKGCIYLSGGMETAVDQGIEWRKTCSKVLRQIGYQTIDIAALDKLYNEECGYVYLKDEVPHKFLEYKANIQYQLIYTDLKLIETNTDAVVAYYDQSFKDGAGSFAECQKAYDCHKPLFIVSELDRIPLWLKGLSTKVVGSFDELYKYLEQLPDGILKIDLYGNHSAKNAYLCSLCGNIFEKTKHHFVSKISPLYCKSCVDLVARTREEQVDRYLFSVEKLKKQEFSGCLT